MKHILLYSQGVSTILLTFEVLSLNDDSGVVLMTSLWSALLMWVPVHKHNSSAFTFMLWSQKGQFGKCNAC